MRHAIGMRALCLIPLLMLLSHAQTPPAPDPYAADRVTIEKIVREYKDTDHKLDPDRGPWSEVTPPRLSVAAITFLAPNVAMVEAVSTQYGTTLGFIHKPFRLTMRKEKDKWSITEIHSVPPPPPPAPQQPKRD